MDVEDLRRAIGPDRFDQACLQRRKSEDLLGSREDPAADVPHELSDPMWFEGTLAAAERIDLLFAVYERMPGYALLMYTTGPFEDFTAQEKERFWAGYRALLEHPDPRLAEPVAYSLWVDYYESPATVAEAWRETSGQAGAWERRLERVLPAAGPVPYKLKAPLYDRLIADRRWHRPILDSLFNSTHDVYGKIDAANALQLLGRLELAAGTDGLKELERELESRARPRRR